jgi:small subunit ribosomal protein S20
LANTRSAEKRNRQAQKRRLRNQHVRTGMRSAVRKVREALARGDAAGAREALRPATRAIGRASSKGVVHHNAAARTISRLAAAVAKAAPAAK